MKTFIIQPPNRAEVLANCLIEVGNLDSKKPWRITIEPYQKRRSIEANAFYWKCCVTPLAKHLGYTPDEMHEVLLGGYFGWKTVEFRGHKREIPRQRSHNLSKMDFMGLTEYGQRIAAEEGVKLPDEDYHEKI